MMVEDQCISAQPSPKFQKQMCHFVYHVETTFGTAPEGNAGSKVSILEAFELDLDDVSPMNSEKYDDDELAPADQPPTAQQDFATMTELEGDETTNLLR
jgi:hypothetical protein